MIRTLGGLACAALLAGCQVVTFGDSNTCGWLAGCAGDQFYWPERMAADTQWPRGWSVLNRGLPGMTAADYGTQLMDGVPSYAGFHLEHLLATDLARACVPIASLLVRRKLVIALGTNDLRARHATPNGIAGAIVALRNRALQVRPCVEVYVATIPPRARVGEAFRARVNAALARMVPANRLIPFGDAPGGEANLGTDGIHMTSVGQDARARVALAVLFANP